MGHRKRISIVLLGLWAVTILAPFAAANTGAVHLTSAYNYYNTKYATYLFWTPDLYGDRLNYNLGTDSHINFTSFSTTSAANPSWTFGEASQNGNATIDIIATNYIRFDTSLAVGKTYNQTFFFAGSIAQVDFNHAGVNTSIAAASFQSSYANFLSAASPAIWHNSSGGYYLAKYTVQPTSIQWDLTAPTVIYTVTMAVSPIASGTTVPSAVFTEPAGTVVTIEAFPASGWVFSSWTSSTASCPLGNSAFASTTVTINATCTVTANFTFVGPPPQGMNIIVYIALLVFSLVPVGIGMLGRRAGWALIGFFGVAICMITSLVVASDGQIVQVCGTTNCPIATANGNFISDFNVFAYVLPMGLAGAESFAIIRRAFHI